MCGDEDEDGVFPTLEHSQVKNGSRVSPTKPFLQISFILGEKHEANLAHAFPSSFGSTEPW